jgi:transducin (beta)-like 1
MDEDSSVPTQLEVPPSDVVTLHGHDSEVYMCSWSPAELVLASG